LVERAPDPPVPAPRAWTLSFLFLDSPDLRLARDTALAELSRGVDAGTGVSVALLGSEGMQLLELSAGRFAVVAELPATDAAGALAAHGAWVARQQPASHHALIVSGHGRGHEGLGGQRRSSQRLGVADGGLRRALDSFARALPRRLDVLGFDACSMGSWEVATALQGVAEQLVASPELSPRAGWQHLAWLQAAAPLAERSGPELAQTLARAYPGAGRHYESLSVLDLTGVPGVTQSLQRLARASEARGCPLDERLLGQMFAYRQADTWDLGSLARAVQAAASCSLEARAAAHGLSAALQQLVRHQGCRDEYCAQSGLSIHIPPLRAGAAPRASRWSVWSEPT
jgi:hypothetical protein